jgi:prepilin-type N-terminal cleavage/methylation domain-containing protein
MVWTDKSRECAMNRRGFTLIEVLASITILFLVLATVFYYFSGSMRSQQKLSQKYILLRISREFIDNFNYTRDRGRLEKEGYILDWQCYPLEKSRVYLDVMNSGSLEMQLKLIHLDVFPIQNSQNKLSINFIYNAFAKKKP